MNKPKLKMPPRGTSKLNLLPNISFINTRAGSQRARLYMNGNTLNGPIPSSITNASKLTHLGMDHNSFSGSIPDFGDLRLLRVLRLRGNNFTAAESTTLELGFLSSLTSCRYLEVLDVSDNPLHVILPAASIGNLSAFLSSSLEQVDALSMVLDGEIPNEGPFVNFTAQSFVHNSALCGSSRFQVPPCIKNHHARLKDGALLVAYIVASFFSAMIWVIILFVLTRIPLHSGDHDRIPDGELGAAWRIISHRELVQGTNGFSKTNLLGRGGCGSVYKGTLSDGLDIAVKVFDLESEGAGKSFDTECEILSSVRHRNIVGIIGCCTNQHFKALVLTYMPNGSLEDWLYYQDVVQILLNLSQVSAEEEAVAGKLKGRLLGFVRAVSAEEEAVAGKLKRRLPGDMTAHLADFGIGKLLGKREAGVHIATLQATFGYAAPEYGSEGKVSTNVDVYSYGIMLLEMFTGKKPTDDMFYADFGLKEWVTEAVERNAISEVVNPALLSKEDPHLLPKEFRSVFHLAMKCIANSPSDRINMIEVVFLLQNIKYNIDSEMTRKSSPYYTIAAMSPCEELQNRISRRR
ncbi:hypothetical protein ACS0TY_028016 [Phlomoides rotata]